MHSAIVFIHCGNRQITARAVMDSCSTHSLITEDIAAALLPKRNPANLSMTGAVSQLKWCSLSVSTAFLSEVDIPLNVAIAKRLPTAIPPNDPIKFAQMKMLHGLKLADESFVGKKDLIIGTYDWAMFLVGGIKFSSETRLPQH